MINKRFHTFWLAILLSCTLSLASAEESNDNDNSDSDDQMQMTDTQLGGPNIMNSLMNVPDTNLDTSRINAAQQQNQMNQQQRNAHIEAVVRQEQNDPELQRQRERGSNENATGMMTPNGRERDTENLTDAERLMSEEFIHEEKSERIYKEECGGDNTSLCDGRADPNAKGILGMKDSTVEMMAKAYSMIVGLAGGDFTKAPKEGTDAEASDSGDASSSDSEDDSVSDYCRYIPMGVEAMAMFKQMSAQDNIQEMPSASGSRQRDTLLKAAKSHQERAKQAKIQATGWTATLACYVGYAFTSIDLSSPSYWIKLSGSALFSTHYWDSVDRHKDDAKKVKKIADKLPSKGDCNPVTDRLCYCTEESTRNDPDFCMPQIRDRHVNKMAEYTTPCINSKGKTDVECKCRDSNSCFDREIEDSLRGVGFSTSDLQGIRPVQELSRGSLSSTGLNQAQQTNSALRNRIRKDLGKKLSDFAKSRRLSPEQQKDAEELTKQGLPKPMAEILSSAPMNSEAKKKMAEMKKGGFGPNKKGARPSNYRRSRNSIRTTGGGGLNPGSKPSDDDSGNEFADMMKKLNGEDGRETASGGQVLRFAERAQNAAQISKREDTFLFDIISHRYQKTAWKRFDVDFDALPEVNE